jgi:hypothetical protein
LAPLRPGYTFLVLSLQAGLFGSDKDHSRTIFGPVELMPGGLRHKWY